MLFLVFLSVFVASAAAAECLYDQAPLRAIEISTGLEIGKVAIDLNDSGSLGLTSSSNVSLWASFASYTDCVNEFPQSLKILNNRNRVVPYASFVSGFKNCNDASFPGWLLFTPSDAGPPGPYPHPGPIFSTLQHTWGNPSIFCGETMNWEIELGRRLVPNWINPNGQPFHDFPILYDRTWNRIVFASSVNDYPGVATAISLTWW
ncbi:hypothetical protein DL96DRAFT_1628637 [Flagelloscypha sp. PMI_526]|nr:hypothetical protein DL96DRAFT_1628637 [Flagelloscypha sp. PMI_526]